MTKKPLTTARPDASAMNNLINPDATPAETIIPQRSVEPAHDPVRKTTAPAKAAPERRSDMLSVKIKPSYRERIKALSKEREIQIAQIIEEAFDAYEAKIRRDRPVS